MRGLIRRAAVVAGAAVVLLGPAAETASAGGAPSAGAAPSIPFTQCPPVGASPWCAVLIVVNPDRSVGVYTDSRVGPMDGGEDTLIGIVNLSPEPVDAITVYGPTGLFDFDGDGLCDEPSAPGGCPFGPTGYEGPGTSFVADPASAGAGEVDFADGLAAGGQTYFSLEGGVTAATLTVHLGHLPYLLGLGDSIAAGYGLGPSGPLTGGPSNGNTYAYPVSLAFRLGLVPRNLAVEGDLAAGGADGGVLAQICQSVDSSINDSSTGCLAPVAPVENPPRLITLTVGADDIGFDKCLINALTYGLTPDNPCAGSHLTSRLVPLVHNLTVDLSLLEGYYPNAPVIVTGYYNPLGNQSVSDLAACPLTTAAVVVPLITNKEWPQLFRYLLELYVRTSNDIPGVPVQNIGTAAFLSAFANQVLTRLNRALANTVSGSPNATFVPISIGSQGLCSDSPLIFEPQAQASWVLHTPLLPDSPGSFSFGQQNKCTGPKDPEEAKFTVSGSDTVPLVAGQTLDYSYSASPNCVPHPTIAGQQSIMQQILPHVPAGVASSP